MQIASEHNRNQECHEHHAIHENRFRLQLDCPGSRDFTPWPSRMRCVADNGPACSRATGGSTSWGNTGAARRGSVALFGGIAAANYAYLQRIAANCSELQWRLVKLARSIPSEPGVDRRGSQSIDAATLPACRRRRDTARPCANGAETSARFARSFCNGFFAEALRVVDGGGLRRVSLLFSGVPRGIRTDTLSDLDRLWPC